MDLYDEKEEVISSDEYSDDDDDDDALMNDAIRAQNRVQLPSRGFMAQSNKQFAKWQIEQQKQKQLSSLIRRNKISVIYKNKAIKWLNNKKQRERYREHIYGNAKDSILGSLCNFKVPESKDELKSNIKEPSDTLKIKAGSADVNKVVSIDDDDDEDDNDCNTVHCDTIDKNIQNQKSLEPTAGNQNFITQKSTKNDVQMKLHIEDVYEVNSFKQQQEATPQIDKVKEVAEKRARSSSPSILNNSNDTEIKRNETKKYRTESPQFYKKINEMFPKFDEIATNHIDTTTNSTLTAIEEKMKNIINEIQTLNEIMHTKEMEWNRLLHLKTIKEEIYTRLFQKKRIVQLKENYTKAQSQNTLSELKELECYLSEKNTVSSETNISASSIQQLIENRANMKAEDLEREKNNTSRLHSLLVSRNMLHGVDSSQNDSFTNGDKSNMAISNKSSATLHNVDIRSSTLLNNRGRQGAFKDVQSIIADFRQKNPEHLPRVGKRIKSCESNAQIRNFSIPLFDKTIAHPQYLHFTKDHQSELYPLRNSVEEFSISPMGGSAKKLSSSHDTDFVNTMNNHYNVSLNDNYIKGNSKRDFDVRSPNKNFQYPLCQECKSHESRFVCAGCGNQWYCSKKCQISAWDKHSEICTD